MRALNTVPSWFLKYFWKENRSYCPQSTNTQTEIVRPNSGKRGENKTHRDLRYSQDLRTQAFCILPVSQYIEWGFLSGSVVQKKKSTCQCRDMGSLPELGKSPWSRKWQSTLVFLPGESHGQRSLAGCSSWGPKESDMTEQLSTHREIEYLNE